MEIATIPERENIMSSENWDNKEKMGMRTKIALRVLMLMFKIVSPYQFGHQFEKDIAQLDKQIQECNE